ncbi:hypothetical protein BGW41_003129 [Actinomortierella wolfii]|nr:hypothetical protein BGW41_003129 [Actinomortierella wolfii]
MLPRTPVTLPPELIDNIVRHLDYYDIAQCALVSRSWNTLMTPLLWRTLAIYNDFQAECILRDEAWEALVRNAPFVCELHLVIDELFERLLPPAHAYADPGPEGYADVSRLFTNIPTLYVHECISIPREELDQRILAFIRQNHGLKHLEIRRRIGEKPLLDIVMNHVPNLETFILHDWKGDIKALLENLPEGIRHVHLKRVAYGKSKTRTVKSKAPVKRHNELQSFTFICDRHNRRFGPKCIVPFLESCSQKLQKVDFGGIEAFHKFITEALKKIGFVWKVLPPTYPCSDERRAEIVSLSKQWTHISLSSHEASPLTMAAIVENCEHLETIEFLRSWNPYVITGSDLQMVLNRAKSLKCVVAHWLLDNNSITATDILSSQWASSSLEHIDFKIVVPRAIGEVSEETVRFSRDIQRQVLRRLGQQKRLRKLVLGGMATTTNTNGFGIQVDCLEMTLESGLDELAGLKELQVLDIHHMDHRVGVPELEWMVEHLPKLRRLIGMCDYYYPCSPDVEKWLQTHRPTWLRTIEDFRETANDKIIE